MNKLLLNFIFIFFVLIFNPIFGKSYSKIIICGVCKDVEKFLENDFLNIEKLGSQFSDYKVVIYENNSKDNTKSKLIKWKNSNNRVVLFLENLSYEDLRKDVKCFTWNQLPSRMELIAKARNKILAEVKKPKYDSYDYVLMVDLDFQCEWPITEILNTLDSEIDWDCVSANGITPNGFYYDRYALRDSTFPLGPELLGEEWWHQISKVPLRLFGNKWKPVYSAFGGLAIYKRKSILDSEYCGAVTDELEICVKNICKKVSSENLFIKKYLSLNNFESEVELESMPVLFCENSGYYNYPVCCEHVTFHASMILNGYDRIFINPKLIMRY